MNIRNFKYTRAFHKWAGFVCAVFIIVLSISGILLMHHEELGLAEIRISGKYLPWKYFHVESQSPAIQALAGTPGNPGTLFVGTRHGLFRSRDGGKHWSELKEGLFNLNIRSIAISPQDPETVFAGTARGIFKSENGGGEWLDWFEESSGLPAAPVNDILLVPGAPDILYAGTGAGLYFSEDSGDTWEAVFQGQDSEESRNVRVVALSTTDPRQLYIGTPRGAFRTTDGGRTWERKWSAIDPDIRSFVFLPTDPEFIYVGTGSGLYKSFNRGISWIKDSTLKGAAVSWISADSGNISRLIAAGENKIWISLDGGDHWNSQEIESGKNIDSGAPIPHPLPISRVLALRGPSSILAAGTPAGLLISGNGGKHWVHQDLGRAVSSVWPEEQTMDLVKLFTEIHTGRFFGSYVYLLVDLATVGLLFLVISGLRITFYRYQVERKKKKYIKREAADEELAVDAIIEFQETADDLSLESHQIHDMIEHINEHLDKCKTVYLRKEKKEIEEIGRHIYTLDKKMHHLMGRLEEFENISRNGDGEASPKAEIS